MNYNFMATKDPKYQLYAGIRFAGTSFHYDITDITVDNGYWHDSPSRFEIVDQHSSAIWGEFVLGIQVEIVKNFSLGWAVRYNFPFSIKDTPNSRPWYIPGYGTRDNPLNISLSASYTLPFHKRRTSRCKRTLATARNTHSAARFRQHRRAGTPATRRDAPTGRTSGQSLSRSFLHAKHDMRHFDAPIMFDHLVYRPHSIAQCHILRCYIRISDN